MDEILRKYKWPGWLQKKITSVIPPVKGLKEESSVKMMTANSDTVIAMYLFYLLF